VQANKSGIRNACSQQLGCYIHTRSNMHAENTNQPSVPLGREGGLVIVIFRNTNSWNSYSCVSLEWLANLCLLIPEGIVERRTALHPVRDFTSIGHDCVDCFIGMWKGDCLGSSSRGQPRGALPLHQVTQRQFIKFADPTGRSGHNNLLHVLPRHVHIIWYQSSVSSVGLFLFLLG
jgi:hypothetical protein